LTKDCWASTTTFKMKFADKKAGRGVNSFSSKPGKEWSSTSIGFFDLDLSAI